MVHCVGVKLFSFNTISPWVSLVVSLFHICKAIKQINDYITRLAFPFKQPLGWAYRGRVPPSAFAWLQQQSGPSVVEGFVLPENTRHHLGAASQVFVPFFLLLGETFFLAGGRHVSKWTWCPHHRANLFPLLHCPTREFRELKPCWFCYMNW